MRLTPAQLVERCTMVTATDIVILAGSYPAKRSVTGIYLEKIARDFAANDTVCSGELVDDEEENASEAVELGHETEPLNIRIAAKKKGFWYRPAGTIRDVRRPWAGSTPDGFACEARYVTPDGAQPSLEVVEKVSPFAVVEAKLVGRHRYYHWGREDEVDPVPEYVLTQVQWQMTTSTMKYAFVCALFGTEHRVYLVEHSPELEEVLLEVGYGFWHKHVVPRIMPPVDGTDDAWRMVKRALPKVRRPEILRATDAMNVVASAAIEAKGEAAAWELEEKRQKQELGLLIGDAAGMEGTLRNGAPWRATFSERKGYTRADGTVVAPTRALTLKELAAPVVRAKKPGKEVAA